MTQAASPWLPNQALHDSALDALIASRANAWSARWFAEARHVSVRREKLTPQQTDALAKAASGLCVRLDPQFELPLAHWALGLINGAHKLKKGDQAFFKSLADVAIADLCETLAGDVSVAPQQPAARTDGLVFALSMGAATNVARIIVSRAWAIAARRSLLAPRARKRPTHTPAMAVAPEPVRVEARVGGARLGVGELLSLRAGDVVVLDRGQDAWGGVELADVPCPALRSLIEHEDGALKLRVRLADMGEL